MKLNMNNVLLKTSVADPAKFPRSAQPQIAFSGRSNVGKSSLINTLLGRKSFARVSSAPGKTVTLNYFEIDKKLLFVDLPGYGYAKREQSEKKRWADLMEGYFQSGRNIKLVIQLIDMRHAPSADDMTMLNFLRETEIPFVIALTKCDKLNKTEYATRTEGSKTELADFVTPDSIIAFSAKNGEGAEKIRSIIEEICNG